jgi:hypothetical protein
MIDQLNWQLTSLLVVAEEIVDDFEKHVFLMY